MKEMNMNKSDKETLKPCPFCGSNKVQLYVCPNEVKTAYVVQCIDCGASSAYMHSRKDAIEMWNRRNENEKI